MKYKSPYNSIIFKIVRLAQSIPSCDPMDHAPGWRGVGRPIYQSYTGLTRVPTKSYFCRITANAAELAIFRTSEGVL